MQLNSDDANKIAKKIKAEIEPGRKHDLAKVRYGGKFIGMFGIRRSSDNVGHDYIPRQIHVTPKQAKLMAQCTMSFEQWVAVMKEKKLIPDIPDEQNTKGAVKAGASAKRKSV